MYGSRSLSMDIGGTLYKWGREDLLSPRKIWITSVSGLTNECISLLNVQFTAIDDDAVVLKLHKLLPGGGAAGSKPTRVVKILSICLCLWFSSDLCWTNGRRPRSILHS